MKTKPERERDEAVARAIVRAFVSRRGRELQSRTVARSHSGGVPAGNIPSALARLASGGTGSSCKAAELLTPAQRWLIDVDNAMKAVDAVVGSSARSNVSLLSGKPLMGEALVVQRVATFILMARLHARPKTAEGSFTSIAASVRKYTADPVVDLLENEARTIYGQALEVFISEIARRELTLDVMSAKVALRSVASEAAVGDEEVPAERPHFAGLTFDEARSHALGNELTSRTQAEMTTDALVKMGTLWHRLGGASLRHRKTARYARAMEAAGFVVDEVTETDLMRQRTGGDAAYRAVMPLS